MKKTGHTNLGATRFPLVSDQVGYDEIEIILHTLQLALTETVAGDVVEMGCYTGTTSLFLQRLLRSHNRTLHVYDSFAGLPEKTVPDISPAGEQFVAGALTASKSQFIKHFKHAGLPLPVIHKAWFHDLTAADMPAAISFAFLDGDYYESIMDSLRLITPRLMPNAYLVIDDYQSEALPGAQKAVDAWLRHYPNNKLKVAASLAIIGPFSAA